MYTISSRSIIQHGSGEFQTISGTVTIIKSASGFALIRISFFPAPVKYNIITRIIDVTSKTMKPKLSNRQKYYA